MSKHVIQSHQLNTREDVHKCPGWYLICTPQLASGLKYTVLYNPQDEIVAKAKRPMTGEARQMYAREYIQGLKNES